MQDMNGLEIYDDDNFKDDDDVLDIQSLKDVYQFIVIHCVKIYQLLV